jgi:16S rRNA processing protein RimM
MQVSDADDGRVYGKLTDVMQTGANDVYEITDDAGKTYLMPAVKQMVIDVNIEAGEMKIRPVAGIFDDAD